MSTHSLESPLPREGRDARSPRTIFWVAVVIALALLGHGLWKWRIGRSTRDRWGAPALAAVSIWSLVGVASARLLAGWVESRTPARGGRVQMPGSHYRWRLVASLASLAGSLTAAEFAARRWLPAPPLEWLHDYANPATDRDDWQSAFCEFDAELGWRGRANASGSVTRPGLEFSVEQNEAGFRDVPHAATESADRRIVVLGDSFVWGFGVAQDETLTDRLRNRSLGAAIFNLGVCGYGTDQSLINLRRCIGTLRPSWVTYLFYVNDLSDNQSVFQHGHFKPRFSLLNGSLEMTTPPSPAAADAARPAIAAAGAPPGPLALLVQPLVSVRRVADYYISPRSVLYRYARRSLDRPVPESDAVVFDALTAELVVAMRRECDQARSGFTLVLVPDRAATKLSDPSRRFEAVRAWAAGAGIDCLDLSVPLAVSSEPTYLDEGHWNATGHDVAAAAIDGHLGVSCVRE